MNLFQVEIDEESGSDDNDDGAGSNSEGNDDEDDNAYNELDWKETNQLTPIYLIDVNLKCVVLCRYCRMHRGMVVCWWSMLVVGLFQPFVSVTIKEPV